MTRVKEFIVHETENTSKIINSWTKDMMIKEYEVVGYQVIKHTNGYFSHILIKY